MARGTHTGPGSGGLAAETTSFVDRLAESTEVKRLLNISRLVTLTGVGGAGKTRLALRVGRELRRAYPDGVWQVDLAELADGSVVKYAVGAALGLRGSPEVPLSRVLADHLADRDLLLLLDNCEHVLDATAPLIDSLLRAAPGLRVLCTSRQPLGMLGETVVMVPPLPVPPAGVPLVNGAVTAYAAVVLGFALTLAVLPFLPETRDVDIEAPDPVLDRPETVADPPRGDH
jgi:non-specific serine/threonine protein kinase